MWVDVKRPGPGLIPSHCGDTDDRMLMSPSPRDRAVTGRVRGSSWPLWHHDAMRRKHSPCLLGVSVLFSKVSSNISSAPTPAPPPPPRKKRPVSFQAPQHRLTSGDSAHDQWHGGYTHLKCETFSMLEELPWQTVSVRLSDKLQGQKQKHIRFRDLIWTITLWNTKQWMFGANWTTRTANPVISREMYPCRAAPCPAAAPPPPYPVW